MSPSSVGVSIIIHYCAKLIFKKHLLPFLVIPVVLVLIPLIVDLANGRDTANDIIIHRVGSNSTNSQDLSL